MLWLLLSHNERNKQSQTNKFFICARNSTWHYRLCLSLSFLIIIFDYFYIIVTIIIFHCYREKQLLNIGAATYAALYQVILANCAQAKHGRGHHNKRSHYNQQISDNWTPTHLLSIAGTSPVGKETQAQLTSSWGLLEVRSAFLEESRRPGKLLMVTERVE